MIILHLKLKPKGGHDDHHVFEVHREPLPSYINALQLEFHYEKALLSSRTTISVPL